MIQLNLLPDVKAQYIRSKVLKRLTFTIAFLVSAAALLILVLLILYVDVLQKHHLDDLTSSVTTSTATLSDNGNLNNILTIQKQLNTLSSLQSQSPEVTKLLTYITQITPSSASISSLDVDFTQNTFSISGSADSLYTVNKFVDTIEAATYTIGSNTTSSSAFSSVLLSSFGYSTNATNGQPAEYTITFSFDPAIFNNADNVLLNVPNETTNRSVNGVPVDLFEKANTSSTSGGGQ